MILKSTCKKLIVHFMPQHILRVAVDAELTVSRRQDTFELEVLQKLVE